MYALIDSINASSAPTKIFIISILWVHTFEKISLKNFSKCHLAEDIFFLCETGVSSTRVWTVLVFCGSSSPLGPPLWLPFILIYILVQVSWKLRSQTSVLMQTFLTMKREQARYASLIYLHSFGIYGSMMHVRLL